VHTTENENILDSYFLISGKPLWALATGGCFWNFTFIKKFRIPGFFKKIREMRSHFKNYNSENIREKEK
jgi:hypothetical protein